MIPEQLVKEFSKGAGSVFVGAGASIAAGLPSWTELIEPLRAKITDCPPSATLPDVAQFYENQFSRLRLEKYVEDRLGHLDAEPTDLHFALAEILRVGRIYTTNFDTLIEDAAKKLKIKFRTILNTDPPVSFDRDLLTIVKLHGDMHRTGSYIITSQDYESFFRRHPGLTTQILSEFQTGTVLFLGYSHNDPDLRMIIRRVTDQNGHFSRRHYSVQREPGLAITKDLDRRCIEVIPVHSRSDSVVQWVAQLCAEVGRVADRSIRPNHNFPHAAHTHLLGREPQEQLLKTSLRREEISIISISGFAGVGKTALAYSVGLSVLAPQATEPLFDYGVWVSANKPEQKRWLTEVLNAIATTLTGSRLSTGDDWVLKDRYELLSGRRVLIIINNYELVDDPELDDWVRGIPPLNKVVLTTRHQDKWLDRCQHINLIGLTADKALAFAKEKAQSLDLLGAVHDPDLVLLADLSLGNPQVIKLALGLVKGGTISLLEVIEQLRGAGGAIVHDGILQDLYQTSWRLLSDDAKKLLMLSTLFVATSVSRKDALYEISGLEERDFYRALEQLVAFRLFEPTYDGRYITHSMTRTFARNELKARPELARATRRPFATHFLKFTSERIVRRHPSVPYWNTLVSDEMEAIDAEWPSTHTAISWADDNQLIQYVMLLAHYLDSRFLNSERIEYVSRAIKVLVEQNRHSEEALLRIDALSWTLMEANEVSEALREIDKGLAIAETYLSGQDAIDLRALALAWKARVIVESGKPESVEEMIREAMSLDSRPWIKHRVHMAAGDIAMKENRFDNACANYEQCALEVKRYGGEGHGYQIAPRLAMACIRLGDFAAAEKHLEELKRFEPITIGHMYLEYCQALLARAAGQTSSANDLLDRLRRKILAKERSNILLQLIDRASDYAKGGDSDQSTGKSAGS